MIDQLYYFNIKCVPHEDPANFSIKVTDINEVVRNKQTENLYQQLIEDRSKSDNLISMFVYNQEKQLVVYSEDEDYLRAFHKGVWFSFDHLPTYIHKMVENDSEI